MEEEIIEQLISKKSRKKVGKKKFNDLLIDSILVNLLIVDSRELNQDGENIKIDLQDTIDNRNDEYCIKPIDIFYYVGYYNITQALGNNPVTYFDGIITNTILFPDGLYTLQSYFETIKTAMSNAGRNETNINYSYIYIYFLRDK